LFEGFFSGSERMDPGGERRLDAFSTHGASGCAELAAFYGRPGSVEPRLRHNPEIRSFSRGTRYRLNLRPAHHQLLDAEYMLLRPLSVDSP
jgi:hypothetical protein